MNKRNSFTLIELLVVISIIGLFLSIVQFSFKGARDKARTTKSLELSQSIQNSLGSEAVGVWSFDEGSDGAILVTAQDSSGYENNGICSGAACPVYISDTPHKTMGTGSGKYALSFDGNDYVIKNPFNNFPSTEITIEFWMKSSDTTKAGTPFSYGGNNEFLIYNYRNFGIYIGGPYVSTGISANDGSWHHIVITWKSLDGNVRVYKDGVQKYSGTLQRGYSIISNKSLVFGQEQDSEGGGFDASQAFLGQLDEVRIYGKALTSAEIQQHYVEGSERHLSYLKQ